MQGWPRERRHATAASLGAAGGTGAPAAVHPDMLRRLRRVLLLHPGGLAPSALPAAWYDAYGAPLLPELAGPFTSLEQLLAACPSAAAVGTPGRPRVARSQQQGQQPLLVTAVVTAAAVEEVADMVWTELAHRAAAAAAAAAGIPGGGGTGSAAAAHVSYEAVCAGVRYWLGGQGVEELRPPLEPPPSLQRLRQLDRRVGATMEAYCAARWGWGWLVEGTRDEGDWDHRGGWQGGGTWPCQGGMRSATTSAAACFLDTCRCVVTLWELERHVCASEGVEAFGELRLGPLTAHPVVRRTFFASLPPAQEEMWRRQQQQQQQQQWWPAGGRRGGGAGQWSSGCLCFGGGEDVLKSGAGCPEDCRRRVVKAWLIEVTL